MEVKAHSYEAIAEFLAQRTRYRPKVLIICGSGLSGLSQQLEEAQTIDYQDIPGFPEPGVAGHFGELVFGMLNGIECVCMRGRFHSYEGFDMQTVTLPVRVMRLLGAQLLLVTNAAGALNRDYNVGDIMVINDHFALPCLAGKNPLVGRNNALFGPRFPPLSDAYDPELQKLVEEAAEANNVQHLLRKGTYCFVSGPTYETPSECRFLMSIGDAVGMSTVPEIIVARHCGMAVLGLSLMTNKVVLPGDIGSGHASHEEVLAATKRSTVHVEGLVRSIISKEKLEPYLSKLPTFVYTPTPAYEAYKRRQLVNKITIAAGALAVLGAAAFAVVRNLK